MDSAVIEPSKPVSKPISTILIAGTEQTKRISKAGWEASKAIRAERAKAKLLPAALPPELDSFTAARLLRVRKQLNMIDDEIDNAIKASSMVVCPHCSKDHPDERDRVKPLVEAQSRLSEQERFLANRPGPGTRKPAPERTKSQSSQVVDPSEM